MIKRAISCLVTAGLVAALGASYLMRSPHSRAQAAAQDSNPVKIGFIASLSGVGIDASTDMVNGIKLYLKQHHNQLGGRKAELVVENDQSSPPTAMGRALKLVQNDHVDVLSGVQLSWCGLAVAPVAEKLKTPLLLSVCGADDLTQRKHNPWVIRTSATASQPVQPFGEWVYKNLGYKRIVTIGVDYPYGWEVVGGFQKGFETAGGQVVQKIWVPMGFTDFKSLLQQVDQNKADAAFLCVTSQPTEILPKQYKDLGIKLPVVAGGTTFDEAYLSHMPASFAGSYSPMAYCAALDLPANKKFVALYKENHGKVPSYYAEAGYVSGMWLDKAIEDLHGDVSDKQKFLAALKKVELNDAPRGPIKLDGYGNPVENIYIRKLTKSGSGLVNTVAGTFRNVSQFWTWSPDEFLRQPVYSKEYPPCTHCQ